MNLPGERAHWLAVLGDPKVDRGKAKAALYHWAIEQQQPVGDLAGLSADALRQRLPALDAAQAEAWRTALAKAQEAGRRLEQWQEQGFNLITRADAAYPENWSERLAERWLPYALYYRGNIELLANPTICLAGAEAPSDAAGSMADSAAAQLGPGAHVLLGGYGQGIDRRALCAGSQALGRTILILPLGFAHARPILRAGQTAIEQGRRIELSPFEPEAAYTPALGRARQLLVTALADVLVLIEPDLGPDAWPGYDAFPQHSGLSLIWEGSSPEMCTAWQAVGARPFDGAQAIERAIADYLLPAVEEIALTEEASDEPLAEPIHFHDADSAIQRLSETGRVPDALARRLRDAQERGWLGDD